MYSHKIGKERTTTFTFATALFNSLVFNAAKSSIPFDSVRHQPQAWWFSEVEVILSSKKKLKAFASAHKSDQERQPYISASRYASPIIAKSKAKVLNKTCSSLSPKSVSLLQY